MLTKSYLYFFFALFIMLGIFISSGSAQADKKVVFDQLELTSEVRGCGIDMKQHCMGVTPGENRQIMCLYAYEDQLLDECKVGLWESALATELGIVSLDYAYAACGSARAALCGDKDVGEGRVLSCMKAHESQLSEDCVAALKMTGIWNASLAEIPAK